MKNYVLLVIGLCFSLSIKAQQSWINIQDNEKPQLTLEGARHLAALPLKCLLQEFPNKTSHISAAVKDHQLLPNELHPAFYGCFDWHSSVHGHWMLIRLLKLFPSLPEASLIRKTLNETLTAQNMEVEAHYFEQPLNASFERTYGWAWILKLEEELIGWEDPDGIKWRTALQPLTQKVISRWKDFIPKQTYPNRTGVHGNTAFGLGFAIDYARKAGDAVFEKILVEHSMRIYGKDRDAPVSWEPDGADFFSPSLMEADLLRRILSPKEFVRWMEKFLPVKSIRHLAVLPVVSDRGDYQIIHLDGLSYSRAWTMYAIAAAVPAKHAYTKILKSSAEEHLLTAIKHMADGNYGGEHWLASFAIYAITNPW